MENGKWKMQSAKRRKMDKRGVSPVIGVILMVAATIVIAAVVIAMLGGFSAPGKTYTVMATADKRFDGTNYDLYVTYQGGPDHAEVSSIRAQGFTGAGTSLDSTIWNCMNASGSWTSPTLSDPTPGDVLWYDDAGPETAYRVSLTAVFKDGTQQIILDTWL